MNHVTHIESNIAGGVDLDLGPKTLIIGKSAGGKTTVVRALELALAGGTSDLEGRAWVGDDPRLLALMPDGAGLVYATATLTDGSTPGFHKVEGKNAKPDGKNSGAQVLALQSVRSELTGSADKARTFIMRAACGGVVKADVMARLPAGLHEVYNALATGRKGNAVDILQAVEKHAAKRARDTRKEAKGAKQVIESMTSAGGSPTEAQVAEATTLASQYSARLHEARHVASTVSVRPELDASIREHEIALEHWAAEIGKIPEMGPDDIVMNQKWEKAAALRTVVEMQQAGGGTECKVCGGAQESHVLHVRMEQVMDALDNVVAGFASRQEALELRQKMVAKHAHVGMALQGLRDRLASLPPAAEPVDLAALEGEATAAEKRRQDLLAAFQAAASLARARALAHEGTEKADRFKRLTDACKDAIGELVQANLALFITRVNRYMPKDMEFGVESGTRFRIGLVHKIYEAESGDELSLPLEAGAERPFTARLHTALSGAEWVAITTAIGSAVTESAEIAVLLPEERAYDPDMLTRIMRGLSKAPAQIILTSTVKFKGHKPAGWTVIQLD